MKPRKVCKVLDYENGVEATYWVVLRKNRENTATLIELNPRIKRQQTKRGESKV